VEWNSRPGGQLIPAEKGMQFTLPDASSYDESDSSWSLGILIAVSALRKLVLIDLWVSLESMGEVNWWS
jgi:hypothetical protein